MQHFLYSTKIANEKTVKKTMTNMKKKKQKLKQTKVSQKNIITKKSDDNIIETHRFQLKKKIFSFFYLLFWLQIYGAIETSKTKKRKKTELFHSFNSNTQFINNCNLYRNLIIQKEKKVIIQKKPDININRKHF